MGKVSEERQDYLARLDRVFGSMPWLKPKEVRTFTAKTFKSGNSLALRLPAELGLTAGMEMNLRVENGEHFSFEPVERPKRKFNLGKVWGSATDLRLIPREDRQFEERPSLWTDLQQGARPAGPK
jgi:antitoxin VapB